MDETLTISRERIFEILSKAFSDITGESIEILDKGDRELFVKKIEDIINKLNHDILINAQREPIKPVEKDNHRIELGWN